MIHITEHVQPRGSVTLLVDGVLDGGAVPVLKGVCDRYLGGRKEILLDLKGISYITREGRGFLQKLRGRIEMVNMPEFVRLERE